MQIESTRVLETGCKDDSFVLSFTRVAEHAGPTHPVSQTRTPDSLRSAAPGRTGRNELQYSASEGSVLLLVLSLDGGEFALLLLGRVGLGRTACAEAHVVVEEGLRGVVHCERL